jgi:hypothetical protein
MHALSSHAIDGVPRGADRVTHRAARNAYAPYARARAGRRVHPAGRHEVGQDWRMTAKVSAGVGARCKKWAVLM